MQAVCF